jgi:hypothetical protein
MAVIQPPMDTYIEQMRGEILHLLQVQMDALQEETFVGLTEEELREYDRRAERIRELAEKVSPQSE